MDTLSVVLLGLIALAVLAQAACLLAIGRGLGRAAGRLTDLGFRVQERLRPAVRELGRAADQAARTSGVLASESLRLHSVLEDAAERVQRAQATLEEAVVPAAGCATSVAAALRVIRSGLRVYRWLR